MSVGVQNHARSSGFCGFHDMAIGGAVASAGRHLQENAVSSCNAGLFRRYQAGVGQNINVLGCHGR